MQGVRLQSGAFTRRRRASYFSLRGQREVTKRNAAPMQRSPGVLPSDSAQRLRGWLTVPPWTGSQLARIPASHPAGFSSATAPLHRGPSHCASCAAKTKQPAALTHFDVRASIGIGADYCSSFSRAAGEGAESGWGATASAPALRSGAQDARYKGPVSGVGRAKERPERWAQWIAPSSLPAHGGAVSEPPQPCRVVARQDARRPPLWGALSFGYFSLSKQRKVTRSPKASESFSATPRMHREAMSDGASGTSHWVPACAGTTSSRKISHSVPGSQQLAAAAN
jgi:hypothetical protein